MATIEDQIAWEQESYQAGVRRFLAALERNRTNAEGATVYNESNSSYGTALVRDVVLPVAKALAEGVSTLGKPQRGRRNVALVMLKEMDLGVAAYVTAKTIIDGITRARSVNSLAVTIAQRMEDQLRVARFEDAAKRYYDKVRDSHKEARTADYRHIRNSIIGCEKNIEGLPAWEAWAANTKLLLGTYLLETFAAVTGLVEVIAPGAGTKDSYLAAPTEKAAEYIKANVDEMRGMYPEWMPCLIPPRDWEDIDFGGYYTPELYRRMPMAKTYTREHKALLKANRRNMGRVFRALNALQHTAFRISPVVLAAFEEAYKVGGTAGMPEQAPMHPEPCAVDSVIIADIRAITDKVREDLQAKLGRRYTSAELAEAIDAALTPTQREARHTFMAWKKAAAKVYTKEQERRGEVLDYARVLAVAKRLAKLDRFYYVYRCDSRGRVYAVGTAVNPQGCKVAKALLEFADAERLGKDGYFWMCVHAANVWGEDKAPYADRAKWVTDNRAMIQAIAAGESDEWKNADEPFEFLKVAHELAACWAHVKAVGREGYQSFRTRACPAMDGTCNGLQHYSMLLRDSVGATHVNLRKAERPNDIYRTVADRANLAFTNILNGEGDLGAEVNDETKEASRNWLDFGLDRAGAKRPVMVVPYGGTRMSCLEYLRAWAEEQADKVGNPFGDEVRTIEDGKEVRTGGLGGACVWGSGILWEAIGETVVSARRGMKFLQGVASAVAGGPDGGEKQGIHWTVPCTGFIVHMMPRVEREVRVKTNLLGSVGIRLTVREQTPEIDTRAIRTAVAPNYVHSLDAAHLMLTICQGVEQGIRNFRVIHDSMGTTPGDTTTLHKCIRAQMLGLHEQEPLQAFLDEQEDRHVWLAEAVVDKKSKLTWAEYLRNAMGDFDRREVLTAPYVFS